MLKNFKSLFIKTEGEEEESVKETSKKTSTPEPVSFPVQGHSPAIPAQPAAPARFEPSDPAVSEVLKVYESGLESINMPGYDFYEFYQSINSTGFASEQAYNMAYQMARTLDKTITPQKLVHDAEFYISKINEVHSQYVTQGQQKLNSIQEKKGSEKNKLTTEIDHASSRIAQLKAELHQLESDINTKRGALSKIEEGYYPQEKAIKDKLNANDIARKTSIDKLNAIKEGILRFIKG